MLGRASEAIPTGHFVRLSPGLPTQRVSMRLGKNKRTCQVYDGCQQRAGGYDFVR
jgi:hypothetical protein